MIVDEQGTILGRGTAGPSDHVDEPATSRRAAAACEAAVAAALAASGLPASAPLEGVAIGMSGYDGAWHGQPPS